jgi:hypothetical protein
MSHSEKFMVVVNLFGIVTGAVAVFLQRPKPRVH